MQSQTVSRTLVLTATLNTTQPVDIGPFHSGRIIVPANSSLTGLTPYESDSVNGTFVPCSEGAITVAPSTTGQSVAIPTAIMGGRYLKLKGNVGGSVILMLKK